jgi:hypothetical protein
MTPCPSGEDFVRYVDGALSVEQTERLEEHLACCPRCREHAASLRTLIEDVRAPLRAVLDVEAHTREVMERLEQMAQRELSAQSGQGEPRARGHLGDRPRRWIFAGAVSAAACVAAGYLGVQTTRVRDPWQARGESAPSSIARDVSIRPCTTEGSSSKEALRPLRPGETLSGAEPLTASFRNLGASPAYLLLFAVDARRDVHWISPPYTRPDEDPVATTLPVSLSERVLDTTAVLENVSPGPLRIVAVISPVPVHVSDIESMGAAVDDDVLLARRFGARSGIRETIVEVIETAGGSR